MNFFDQVDDWSAARHGLIEVYDAALFYENAGGMERFLARAGAKMRTGAAEIGMRMVSPIRLRRVSDWRGNHLMRTGMLIAECSIARPDAADPNIPGLLRRT